MISFFASGAPKAQPRPRATRRGRFVGVYNPDTADHWKADVARAAREHKPAAPLAGAVDVALRFYFQRPASHHRASGEVKPAAPRYHVAKPDTDNLAKAVLDVLTTLAFWGDDSQVMKLTVRKDYVSHHGSEGCIVEIGELA